MDSKMNQQQALTEELPREEKYNELVHVFKKCAQKKCQEDTVFLAQNYQFAKPNTPATFHLNGYYLELINYTSDFTIKTPRVQLHFNGLLRHEVKKIKEQTVISKHDPQTSSNGRILNISTKDMEKKDIEELANTLFNYAP
jgi:hypothetical protein